MRSIETLMKEGQGGRPVPVTPEELASIKRAQASAEPLTELKISPEPPEKFIPQDVTDQELRDLRHLFTYHPPKDGQPAKYEHLRGLAHTLAREYMLMIPPGPEREEAVKAVRSSVMWANAGISCRE